MNRKMKGIKVKDLKIECEYFDCEIPQEYLEKKQEDLLLMKI